MQKQEERPTRTIPSIASSLRAHLTQHPAAVAMERLPCSSCGSTHASDSQHVYNYSQEVAQDFVCSICFDAVRRAVRHAMQAHLLQELHRPSHCCLQEAHLSTRQQGVCWGGDRGLGCVPQHRERLVGRVRALPRARHQARLAGRSPAYMPTLPSAVSAPPTRLRCSDSSGFGRRALEPMLVRRAAARTSRQPDSVRAHSIGTLVISQIQSLQLDPGV